MIFWVSVLLAVMFAFYCAKRGLYDTWATGFNTLIAIYIAIFSESRFVSAFPATGETPFGDMLIVAIIAIVAFVMLQSTSYIFATGLFTVPFPKALDIGGGGILGFLVGLVLWNFVIFVVCNTPVFPEGLAAEIDYTDDVQQSNIAVFSIPCNAVNMIASYGDTTYTTQEVIEDLLKRTTKRLQLRTAPRTQPPPTEPNEPQKPIDVKDLLGPPPEL